jgi:hypothetical protein
MTELTHLRQTRKNFLTLVNSLTTEQLNHIPEGFNNNIIWNFGHSIITHQLLCYNLSGNRMYTHKELVHKYRIGTKPEAPVSAEEIEKLKKMATELVTKFEADVNTEMFAEYKEYTTSYHVTLSNIEDAIKFNNLHEGLHLGYAMAIRRVIPSSPSRG